MQNKLDVKDLNILIAFFEILAEIESNKDEPK